MSVMYLEEMWKHAYVAALAGFAAKPNWTQPNANDAAKAAADQAVADYLEFHRANESAYEKAEKKL